MTQFSQEPPNNSQGILIIDDEQFIAETLQEIAALQGVNSFIATNGKQGVEIFKSHREAIDLIFLDLVMPVMDGKTAFREIKKIEPDQTVFIMSGYSLQEDINQLLNNGAASFIKKPFDIKDIINLIQVHLEIQKREKIFQ